MNPCACGFPSIDHWGMFPDGGCTKAPTCKGFQKATTSASDPVPAPHPSILEGGETLSPGANVTGSPSDDPAKTGDNLTAPPATPASEERPTDTAAR